MEPEWLAIAVFCTLTALRNVKDVQSTSTCIIGSMAMDHYLGLCPTQDVNFLVNHPDAVQALEGALLSPSPSDFAFEHEILWYKMNEYFSVPIRFIPAAKAPYRQCVLLGVATPAQIRTEGIDRAMNALRLMQ
ncbi:hypothetical protein BDV29DRAFT_154662 [Aspergillus leporis]|uniref:Uncharacterized protein n=1 Tax=Aspergillus leporis TaxID=41062 RepID=A0A5N5X6W0_9EURO|nr:hypothetical protein BDV29DRAFT_154662 [Aspergillus leporis]